MPELRCFFDSDRLRFWGPVLMFSTYAGGLLVMSRIFSFVWMGNYFLTRTVLSLLFFSFVLEFDTSRRLLAFGSGPGQRCWGGSGLWRGGVGRGCG
ncbi:hypothetical protein BDY21DRAFT_354073 [Lineolata rhizophorae]|uniref:Uncharacterized protein n=1 Tax=Lineolata rhizophorae TaxID=578093 RepID=A0A6A6NQK2_9PEZI|nr:hypothetical protein BDY21DRAFT_354073 [Lineolata rhizophorae]